MPVNCHHFAWLAALALSTTASALEPDQVYRRAAPSVVMVFAADSKAGMQGSGVVVSPERIVTNCHVALNKDGKPYPQIAVQQLERRWPARYIAGKLDYDTCLLAVPGLTAPPVQFADTNTLRVGQRVYAIGAPTGLELTLTDGLLSALRPFGSSRVIQTSAPISHGSSGGGLFDDQARLIGITSFAKKGGNALNFAYYADPIISLVTTAAAQDNKAARAATVQSVLAKAVADSAPPVPNFSSAQEAAAWLSTMDARLAATLTAKNYRLDFLRSLHFEAVRVGLDPQLVLGLIDEISGFRKYAMDSNGARGYMLVQPAWIELVGRPDDNLFDLRTNLRYGCTILRHYLDIEQGDLYRALLRYELAMLKGPGQELPANLRSSFPDRVRAKWRTHWEYSR